MFKFEDTISFSQKKYDLMTMGELLIDMISDRYDDFGSHVYHRYFGGSPSNIAMNTKRLGINPTIVAAVGKDDLGSYLIGRLQEQGVDTSHVQTVDYSTSLVLLTKSKSTPKPVFYREADYRLQYEANLEKAIEQSKILHFSSWPISRLPARKTVEQSIAHARQHNLLVCFDPNYHPMLWSSEEDGVAYVKEMVGKVDIIKPSLDDAERIFGQGKVLDYMDEFLSLGARLVILTLGEEGAIVSNGKEEVRFQSYATEVVNTTGAGDAFWSGFYTALVKGYTLQESLQMGFAVSAYKLKHTEAVVELPSLEEVKKIYQL